MLFCFWLGLDCWVAGFDCWGDGVVGFFFSYYGLWLWLMVVQTQATRLVACVEL